LRKFPRTRHLPEGNEISARRFLWFVEKPAPLSEPLSRTRQHFSTFFWVLCHIGLAPGTEVCKVHATVDHCGFRGFFYIDNVTKFLVTKFLFFFFPLNLGGVPVHRSRIIIILIFFN